MIASKLLQDKTGNQKCRYKKDDNYAITNEYLDFIDLIAGSISTPDIAGINPLKIVENV